MDVLRCDSELSIEFWFPFFSLPCAKWLCTLNWFQFLFNSVPPGANERKWLKDSSRTTTSTTDRFSSGFVQRLLNIYDHSLNKSLIYRSCVPTEKRHDNIFDLAALAHRHSLAANVIVNWPSSHVARLCLSAKIAQVMILLQPVQTNSIECK